VRVWKIITEQTRARARPLVRLAKQAPRARGTPKKAKNTVERTPTTSNEVVAEAAADAASAVGYYHIFDHIPKPYPNLLCSLG